MIVLFAGKEIGLDVLKFLVERRDPIALVFAASEDDHAIMDVCREASVRCEVFSPRAVSRLVETGSRYDWLLNAWSPHILREPVLSLAAHRANLHPSLVPHARGSDSWAWILRKGLPAGVSILEMTTSIDGGGVYAQSKVDVDFPMTGKSLRDKLQREMVVLFRRAWPDMASGKAVAQPQAEGGSYFVRRETNQDRIQPADRSMTVGEFVRWGLAHDFSPGTTAEMTDGQDRYKIRISVAKIDSER